MRRFHQGASDKRGHIGRQGVDTFFENSLELGVDGVAVGAQSVIAVSGVGHDAGGMRLGHLVGRASTPDAAPLAVSLRNMLLASDGRCRSGRGRWPADAP